ncbi:hypothetical protein [Ornithinibacillus halotolerans]|uniref:Uncharacterized protein n=1 Tax=Ornithinibacillus halotolerans TaxID=1274357 RepID=A0A916S805_9BACI|nr:hypothetical protein [Ornithinibacillus halotolerans]GGA87809.1 hypothetical protein GCM10008025_33190 [Ornithinibacillus halotolerans]
MKAMIYFIENIRLLQLESIGISKEALFIIIIFIGIVGSYCLLRPVTSILLSIQSERLISYLLSGLVFIVLFFLFVMIFGEIQYLTYQLLKVALQGLALFGLLLCVIQLIEYVIRMIKKA